MPVAAIEHIVLDDQGVARIAGLRTKVIYIILDKQVNGWGPEEIHQHYPYLSMSQIHAAFAYYYDHQEELDRQIEEDCREAERMRLEAGESPIEKKLRALGKLP